MLYSTTKSEPLELFGPFKIPKPTTGLFTLLVLIPLITKSVSATLANLKFAPPEADPVAVEYLSAEEPCICTSALPLNLSFPVLAKPLAAS
ncbi:hypothetical protein D3C85_1525060 [compost metagenome]